MTLYALDFDATISAYQPGDFLQYGPLVLGPPIPEMVKTVKAWLREGIEVVIYTARDPVAWDLIRDWTEEHLGKRLDVINTKIWKIDRFYDDKAFHVIANTGEIITPELYLEYKEASKRLDALERHGVDNWNGYGDAVSDLYGEED